ncbi:LRR receptor-like serine/threonine-protein kinase RGI2 [Telopea speciosissima]|uniref:LRR receptor-like serine/threonine-protein kinase RGI2 n=1 Tax=Telopea speciosissima TaxID=54955 RepID=UPI001CC78884|nr:LRR receptor-like serine/threonine-protein kinase RGI2 [Telopea speciosissima]
MFRNLVYSLFFVLNIAAYLPISALNHEGLSLLSWLSTFNSSSSSSFFSSWNSTHQDPCKWAYIKCSTEGFVVEIAIKSVNLPTRFPTELLSFNSLTTLVLSNGNLTGEIPASIANLSLLTTLDLSFNTFNGKIPSDIGKLSKLQLLSLNSNSFESEIPPEIGNCSKLQQLELFDNRLTGRIPAELCHLSGLEILRAGGNHGIYGEIPTEISNCKGLMFLGLADTGVSGQIPYGIGELKNLRTLSVYTANLSGEIPPEIDNCSALENLFLYENQLVGQIPAELGQLKFLKRILLWANNLNGNIPVALANCSYLTVIDLSLNSLNGELPPLSSLVALEGLLLSDNNISGNIPPFIGNFSNMKQLELDNNRFSGEIPAEIGQLKELSLFYAWQNQLKGNIPFELGSCEKLQALDLSHNFLSGPVPMSLFNLKNLTQILMISNELSGEIPATIGSCTSLIRVRLGSNQFSGQIPAAIGLLSHLSFLELSENQFSGEIPPEIGNCTQLEMVDLHENKLEGMIPTSIESLRNLNILDLSMNRISGSIPENMGNLTLLNKLVLCGNCITGSIPKSLGLCKDLQLLDMSINRITGSIPNELGSLQGLDILLNLSWNSLSGPIPEEFSNLSRLASLDLSHNMLTGSLRVLGTLENLVSLDLSYNKLSGHLPDTKFFRELPTTFLCGNEDLCINGNECKAKKNLYTRNLLLRVLLSTMAVVVIIIFGVLMVIRTHRAEVRRDEEEYNESDWEFTPFQKLNFSIDDVVTRLSDSNIIGKGYSGVVYRVEIQTGQLIAVKKLWHVDNGDFPERDSFSTEVQTLGSIRHKNIVRLLGCCTKGKTRLLLFDYISNGSLAGLLHEKKVYLNWDSRYNIIMDAAQGLSYLHHDCVPSIVHRDIKSNNILVGPQFEAYLADFGLARLVDPSDHSRNSCTVAGSYGYIAPEYGYSLRITEKSDVYSYGVVLLEVLTGMEPTDHQIPDGTDIVSWVRRVLEETEVEAASILDQQLQCRSGTQIQQMLQVLGVALLCVNPCPVERPTMKDVTALLKEIRDETEDFTKTNFVGKQVAGKPKAAVHCTSFSRSSEPLISSSSLFLCPKDVSGAD